MTCKEILKKYCLDEMTAEAATAAINAATVEHFDDSLWTYSGLASEFTLAKIMEWDAAIKAAGMGIVSEMLASHGIRLTDAESIANIRSMADGGIITQAEADAILALGECMKSPWNYEGNTGDATIEEVAAALTVIHQEANQAALKQWFWSTLSPLAGRIDSGELTTETEIADAAHAALGGE